VAFYQFLEDFQILISPVSTSHEYLITGEYNIYVDDLADSNAIQFLSLLTRLTKLNMSHSPLHGILILLILS